MKVKIYYRRRRKRGECTFIDYLLRTKYRTRSFLCGLICKQAFCPGSSDTSSLLEPPTPSYYWLFYSVAFRTFQHSYSCRSLISHIDWGLSLKANTTNALTSSLSPESQAQIQCLVLLNSVELIIGKHLSPVCSKALSLANSPNNIHCLVPYDARGARCGQTSISLVSPLGLWLFTEFDEITESLNNLMIPLCHHLKCVLTGTNSKD